MPNTDRAYLYIRAYLELHDRAPSLAQIARYLGVSIPTTHYHLTRLEDQGRITRTRRWYGITITEGEYA